MKSLANALAVIGVLLAAYSIIGKFVDQPTIGLGIMQIEPKVGLLLANTLMLTGLVIKSWEK